MVGIVLVSHSFELAHGLADLTSQVAGADVRTHRARSGPADAALGGDDTERQKPSPDPLLYALDRMTGPLYRPIRRILPNLGGVDISPVILLLLIFFVERLIAYYLYPLVIAY